MAENIAVDGVKKENKKKSSKKLHAEVAKAAEEERKRCFLFAIASFFEKSGLSKSRESLLNEAQLEVAGLKVQLFDLEDVFYKFIESSSKDSPKETIVSADKHENKKEPSVLSNEVQEHSKEAKRKRKHFSNSNRESQQEIVPGRIHDECPLDNQVPDMKGFNTESERKRKKIKLGILETKSEDFTHCNTTSEQPDRSNIALKDKKKKKNHTCDFEIPEGNKNQVGSKKIQEPLSHILEPDMTTDKETKSRKKKKNSKTTSECFDSKIGENLDRSSYMNVNNKNSSVPENGDSTKSTFENVKDSISQSATNSKNENIEKKVKSEEVQSVEPKSISPFQRIKIDEVKFANEKLQDNSYWAKGGADSGYGAKAQEVLGQVRGRDFRHEKTKKKRGSYRGGQIDLQSHSIKFNYSDEE